MSKDKLAKDLADEIFDMIDRNYPRGLIKSDLADLIGKHMAAWQTKHDLINPDVFPPTPVIDGQYIPTTGDKVYIYADATTTAGPNWKLRNICGND